MLSDDAARSEYDRTLTAEQAPPQQSPAESVWDQPQPTAPTPQGAYGYMPQEPVTQTVHPRPTFVPPVPAWRRPKLIRRAGIVTAAWLIPMIILAAMSTSRAVEMDAPGGSLLVWSLIPAAATLAVLMLRPSSRWWVRPVAVVVFLAVPSLYGLGGVAVVMLTVTGIATGVLGGFLRTTRGRIALELVTAYWSAAEHPDLSAWFISRHELTSQMTTAQLVDVGDQTQPDRTVRLWGHHLAGSYVIADLSGDPGAVHMTVSGETMRRAKRASKAIR